MWVSVAALVCTLLPLAAFAADPDIAGTTKFGQFMGSIILNLASSITWLGGKLLETSIQKFILEIGNLIGNASPLGIMIGTLWGMIRDICNLVFIFGFIYIGIRTIIDADDSNAKRMLASLIIGALLINFSLYFTKVVIDISNYTAVEIYNATFVGGPDTSLSAKFAESLGILKFYEKTPTGDVLAGMTTGGAFAFYFMAAMLLMVAGFVFASGAILILTRFVALIFIMIFSPLLFAATVFPATAGHAKKLWHQLFSYSFFAPAYLILLLISVKVIGSAMDMLNPTKQGLPNALAKGSADAFSVILIFVIGIMFLIFSLRAAQSFGVAGADRVMAAGGNLRGRGQRILGATTLGVAAMGGRATAGRLGNYLSEKDGWKDAASRRGFKGVMARQALRASRGAADASFDARNVGGVGGSLGIGEGRKGGYQTVKKEIEEKESKFAKSLGEVDDTDVRVEARKKEMQAEEKKLRALEEELHTIQNDPAARALKREEIEKQKRDITDAKTVYESEKQRRIIGSTYAKPKDSDKPLLDAQKAQIDNHKTTLKAAWANYVTLADDQKEIERENIQKIKNTLEEAENEHYKLLNQQEDRGYAGKLEDPSIMKFLTTPLTGRLVHQERAAGKEIRKAAEKGLPKKKED